MSGLPDIGTLALLAVAGGAGSALRFLLDAAVRRAASPRGPLGIFLVNVLASAAIGGVVGAGAVGAGVVGAGAAGAASPLGFILAAGLLGGFSTLSTVAVDSAQLARTRRWRWLTLNTAGMLAVSFAACWGAGLLAAAAVG